MKTSFLNLLISVTLILFLILGISVNERKELSSSSIKIINYYNEFSEEKLIKFIDSLNFKYPEIILAQAKLESGHFKSNVFKSNHNLFGMKQALSRVTLNRGTKNGHALYNKWEDSVMDYALWYATYAYNCNSEEEFLNLLDKTYAEDEFYKNRLKTIVTTQNLKKKFSKNNLKV